MASRARKVPEARLRTYHRCSVITESWYAKMYSAFRAIRLSSDEGVPCTNLMYEVV